MIISSYPPLIGGAERQAQGLSEHLLKRNWAVQVVTRRHNRRYGYSGAAWEVINGVPVHRVFSKGPRPLGAALYMLGGLWLMFRHRQVGSVYYAHDVGAPAWLAVIASHLLGGRSIVKIRSGKAASIRHYQRSGQLSWLSRFVDRFVVVSQETRGVLEQRGIAADRIVWVPNGVNSDRFHPVGNDEKLAARRRLRLPTEKTIAMCVGRLIPVKAYDVLVEACAGLPPGILSELQFVIVGDGPEEENLRTLAQARGLQEHLRFEGHREDVADYYQSADLFVLPSRGEGLSNALVEAMACGLPVVCSAVGGALDWVQPGVNGLLSPSGDAERLKNTMIEMLSCRERWDAMGSFSRQVVEQDLAFTVTGQRLLGAFFE